MDNKEIVKYFYEVIATENQLDEFSRYISENCTQRDGQKRMHLGVEHSGVASTFEAFFENGLIKPV